MKLPICKICNKNIRKLQLKVRINKGRDSGVEKPIWRHGGCKIDTTLQVI